MNDRLHSEAMAEHLRENPAYCIELLTAVARHGSTAELVVLLRQIRIAFGVRLRVKEA
jgi:hypothetical protein